MPYTLRATLVWLCFIPAAILNGGLRTHVLDRLLGPRLALPLSGVILCGLIVAIAALLLPHIGTLTRRRTRTTGLLWALLTVLFEVAFSTADGIPLQTQLAAYNPATGNLWLLVVLVAALAPTLVRPLRATF